MTLTTVNICSIEACYGRLRELIMDAELLPNTHHEEFALAERLFLEPDDVHAAALRLETDALVRTEPYGGFWISPITTKHITAIYNQIAMLEARAAYAAAEHGAWAIDMAALQDAVASMDDALYRHDLKRWARADHHFHRSLIQCSNDTQIIAAALPLCEPIHRTRMVTLALRPPPFDSVREHTELVDAIRRGAAREAYDMHLDHWRTARTAIVELLHSHRMDSVLC